jgi:LSD1 subclass zinc finger protein
MKPIRIKRSGTADPTGSRAVNELEPTVDATPADLAAEAKTELVGWGRMLHEDRGLEFPKNFMTAIARHLEQHLRSIATLEWAGEFVRQTLSLERRMRRVIASSKGRWYAGICSAITREELPHDGLSCACGCHNGADYPCDIDGGCGSESPTIDAEMCDQDLYAEPGASQVRCPKCQTRHSVSQRRSILLAEARETLLPLSVIASACVALLDEEPSVEKFLKRIKKWTDRGELVWSDNDGATRLYRVGDVLDLQLRHAANRNGRKGLQNAC